LRTVENAASHLTTEITVTKTTIFLLRIWMFQPTTGAWSTTLTGCRQKNLHRIGPFYLKMRESNSKLKSIWFPS